MNPIQTIIVHTQADNEKIKDRFVQHIRHIYQHKVFKALMDLVATKAYQDTLKFQIKEQQKFDLDEGNCKTINTSLLGSMLNSFRSNKHYTITIKKIAYDVIVHEIAHMVEQELDLDLTDFVKSLSSDFNNVASAILPVKQAIDDVLIKQVARYPKSHQNSELFARFFQLFATANEISGRQSQYRFYLNDLSQIVPNAQNWIEGTFQKSISKKLNPGLVKISNDYLKNVINIEHKWTEQKISPLHHNKENKKPTWTKAVKSIKDI